MAVRCKPGKKHSWKLTGQGRISKYFVCKRCGARRMDRIALPCGHELHHLVCYNQLDSGCRICKDFTGEPVWQHSGTWKKR